MIPAGYTAAPLENGGVAVVITDADGAPKGVPAGTYNYSDVYRTARAGEIVDILPNGSAYSFDNQLTFEVKARSDGEIMFLYATDLQGIKPMTITTDMADQLLALATTMETATAPSADLDAQMYSLVAPAMQAIDGRTAATGFRYTLNITNATQLRPKHWYAEIQEHNLKNPGTSATTPVFVGLLLIPDLPTGFSYSNQANGQTLGLTMCACICRTWAQIIRQWLSNNYPQPPLA